MPYKFPDNRLFKLIYKTVSQHIIFIKYCIIGASGVALDYLVFYLLYKGFKVHYQYANIFSVSCGILNNFLLNAFLNFKKKDKLFLRFIQFYTVGLIGMAMNALLLYVFVESFHVNVLAAKGINAFVIAIMQYVLNKTFSFKENFNISKESGEKICIFFIAIVLRSILGLIFFGSIDLVNSINNSKITFEPGGLIRDLPYFPVIPAFIWFGGVLGTYTALPIAFCYKIIPILFDGLIAVLIYDIVKKLKSGLGFKAGLLYALAPVPIINDCMHGQHDSIFLFFLIYSFYVREFYEDSKRKYFMFGVLFGFSFMIKPVSLMFILFFFMPYSSMKRNGLRNYLINQTFSVAGLFSIIAVCFSIFKYLGYNLAYVIMRVLAYSSTDTIMFGLPMSYPFTSLGFLKGRFWILIILTAFALFYYLDRVGIFDMLLFSFTVSLGLCGLAPQYLVWIIPLLLIKNHICFSTLYNFICTVFLMLYYMNPDISFMPKENMATLVTLKMFGWLMPPEIFTENGFISVIHFIGNRIIPFLSLIIAAYVMIRAVKYSGRNGVSECIKETTSAEKFMLVRNGYILFNIGLWSLILFVHFALRNMKILDAFTAKLEGKLYAYDMVQKGNGIFIGNYAELRPFNIIFLMAFAAVLWGIIALYDNGRLAGGGLKNDGKF